MTDEIQIPAEYAPSLTLRVVFEHEPEEEPVYRGPAICAGSPEYVGILAVMVGATNILPGLPRQTVAEIEEAVRIEINERDAA